MDSYTLALAALGIGLVVGATVGWILGRTKLEAAIAERDAARARAQEIRSDREAMVAQFRLLAHESLAVTGQRADESAEARLRATEHLLTPVRDSLDRFNRRLADVERERAALTADLSAQVQAVRRTGDDLRRETAALATALRKPQVRGTWGEVQLRRVVELAGMVEHCDFITQATATNADGATIRPDLVVTLAGGRRVYVDSKVPLAAFLEAAEAADDRDRVEHLARFARNVRTHVDQLGGKQYFRASTSSPEFVVLFLPSEALAAEALGQAPDLHEYAAQRNVVIATPTTLIAMLRAVAYGWRQATLADSAAEVFALGRELYDRLVTMGGHFDKVGRSLTSTVRAYNQTLGSLEGRVLVTARKLRELQVTDAELASPQPVEEQPRWVTSPTLLGAESGPEASPLPESGPEGRSLPESGELVRGEPDLADLLRAEAARDEHPSGARSVQGKMTG